MQNGYLIGGGVFPQSVQFGTIALTNAQASNTAAITAVVKANSVVIPLGITFGTIGDVWDVVGFKLVLTSTILVTASRTTQDGTGDCTLSFMVLEFAGGIKSNQDFDIVMNAANNGTAVLTAVDTTKTVLFPRGYNYDSALADSVATAGTLIKTLGRMTLTNATTVTGNRGSALQKLTLSGTALEFA